jgi:hypothetical protein
MNLGIEAIMFERFCPWCGATQLARVTRVADSCVEWECAECSQRWTVKSDRPHEAFAFFPADIDAIGDDELEPLFAGAKP